MFDLIKLFVQLLWNKSSTNAMCLMIVAGNHLDAKGARDMSDYFKALHENIVFSEKR